MTFRVLRKMEYVGTYIYVFQYGDDLFQYMFHFSSGELHQNHIIIRAPVWRRIAADLGWLDNAHTRATLEEAEKILLSGAMKTLDDLASRKAKIEEDKAK